MYGCEGESGGCIRRDVGEEGGCVRRSRARQTIAQMIFDICYGVGPGRTILPNIILTCIFQE